MTHSEVLNSLKEGNKRFTNNELANIDTKQRREENKDGQSPKSAVLACMDSRVPVEKVFDLTIGDMFSFRTPGNVVSKDIIGGMEYAAVVGGTILFVVMGHTACGAVNAAIKGTELGNLTPALHKVNPAISKSKSEFENFENLEFVNSVIVNNAINSIEVIRKESEILRTMEEKGEIQFVPALYNIESGEVSFV